MRIGPAVALLLGLAAGCSGTDTREQIPEDTGEPSAAHPHRSSYRGLYVVAGAPDSGTIRLCEGGELLVHDRTGGELRRAHEALGSGPEGPVFVEVRAESLGAGHGTDGRARVAVLELVRASPVGESAGCAEPPAPYRFRASGNEPFWSVTVGRDSVLFEQPEDPRRISAPLTRREGASRRIFHAQTSGPDVHVIRVTLTPGRCADSMSGALYSFSAEVVVDGRSLSGCARAGDLGEAP